MEQVGLEQDSSVRPFQESVTKVKEDSDEEEMDVIQLSRCYSS